MQLLKFLWARLLEPSSWLAATAFAGAVAVHLQSNETFAAALVAGVMAVLLPEK